MTSVVETGVEVALGRESILVLRRVFLLFLQLGSFGAMYRKVLGPASTDGRG